MACFYRLTAKLFTLLIVFVYYVRVLFNSCVSPSVGDMCCSLKCDYGLNDLVKSEKLFAIYIIYSENN